MEKRNSSTFKRVFFFSYSLRAYNLKMDYINLIEDYGSKKNGSLG